MRLQDARRPVRRQLEAETLVTSPAAPCATEPRGRNEQHRDAEQRDADDGAGRDQAAEVRRGERADEDRRDQDLRRPASVAEREVVGDDGDQSLARRVDDACRHHPRRVAAEPHAHRERLFAVRAGAAEERVEVERDARQVAEVLEQRKDRKEDRHGRQHHRHHPGGCQVDTVEEQAAQPPGETNRVAEFLQDRVRRVDQKRCQQAGRNVRSFDRDPEDRRQDRQHHREAEPPRGEQPIEAPVDIEPGLSEAPVSAARSAIACAAP